MCGPACDAKLPLGLRTPTHHLDRPTAWRVDGVETPKTEKEAHGEFESEHPGYCGAQDTFYVGNLKGVGRIYQQTFIDTYTKVSFAKLYDRQTPITSSFLAQRA